MEQHKERLASMVPSFDVRWQVAGQGGVLRLRALCGLDEWAVHACDTRSALALLRGLRLPCEAVDAWAGDVAAIPTAARDQILLQLYQRCFGDLIQSLLPCTACEERFELDFALSALAQETASVTQPALPWADLVEPSAHGGDHDGGGAGPTSGPDLTIWDVVALPDGTVPGSEASASQVAASERRSPQRSECPTVPSLPICDDRHEVEAAACARSAQSWARTLDAVGPEASVSSSQGTVDLGGAVSQHVQCPPVHPQPSVRHRWFRHQGLTFRLPTGADELAVQGLDAKEAGAQLLARCTTEAQPLSVAAQLSLQEAMQAIAPLLRREIEATCPHCGTKHAMRFDIQSYLLQRLRVDMPRLEQEVHLLARAYGWSLDTILRLSRTQRQAFVRLIVTEQKARPSTQRLPSR